jgi:hypothetical protein
MAQTIRAPASALSGANPMRIFPAAGLRGPYSLSRLTSRLKAQERQGDGLTQAFSSFLKDKTPSACRALWNGIINAASLVDRERKYGTRTNLPLSTRVSLWRRGFLSESGIIYNTQDPDRLSLYLSDFTRFLRTGELNCPFNAVLDDKLYFSSLLRSISDQVAPALGIVSKGKLSPLVAERVEPVARGLRRLGSKLVLKPCMNTSSGNGVIIYEGADGGHRVNGKWINADDLLRRLGSEIYLVCPYVEQAEYAARIFPDVANTIRILTMYDDASEEPFIAAAVHRFGIGSSGPVDNWARGGISAKVNLTSGQLSRGYFFPFDGKLKACSTHPDTGSVIEGVEITGWHRVKDGILDLARRLPFLPYIGWDIVVTDESYVIIEGNKRSDVNLIQVHEPLLANQRVRRFFERHGVVRQAS